MWDSRFALIRRARRNLRSMFLFFLIGQNNGWLSFLRTNDRRDEAIAPPGYCLDKLRPFWVVLQGQANFADCASDAVISIEKDIFAPDFRDNLFSRDNLSRAF